MHQLHNLPGPFQSMSSLPATAPVNDGDPVEIVTTAHSFAHRANGLDLEPQDWSHTKNVCFECASTERKERMFQLHIILVHQYTVTFHGGVGSWQFQTVLRSLPGKLGGKKKPNLTKETSDRTDLLVSVRLTWEKVYSKTFWESRYPKKIQRSLSSASLSSLLGPIKSWSWPSRTGAESTSNKDCELS